MCITPLVRASACSCPLLSSSLPLLLFTSCGSRRCSLALLHLLSISFVLYHFHQEKKNASGWGVCGLEVGGLEHERGRIACKPKAARVAQIPSSPAHIPSSPKPLPAPPLLLVPLVLEAWVVVGGNGCSVAEGSTGPAPPRRLLLRRLLLLPEPLLPEVVLVDWGGLSVV